MNKVIFFDLDGTLIPGNSWYQFNLNFGMTEMEDQVLFDWYKRGLITYDEWDKLIVKVLLERNLCTQEKVDAFIKKIDLRPETIEVINACKKNGYTVIILSGTMKQIADGIRERIGADLSYTTSKIIFNDDGTFKTIENDKDEGPAKLRIFERVCAEHEIDPVQTICVGDSRNDLEMFQKSKRAILLGDNEELKLHAWKQISELKEVIELI